MKIHCINEPDNEVSSLVCQYIRIFKVFYLLLTMLFVGTFVTYILFKKKKKKKASLHSFKSLFLINLHVLFLSLSSISLANFPCILFFIPFIFSSFFFSFLEFFWVSSFLVCYNSTCSDCN